VILPFVVSDFQAEAMRELQVTARDSARWLDSQSAAGVYTVRTGDGRMAYLKVTPTLAGPPATAAAQRELRFYRHLAGAVPVRTPALLGWVDTEGGIALLLEAAGEARDAASWTSDMWADLGQSLAKLHSMPPPGGPGWDRPDGVRNALADPDVARTNAFWAPSLPRLDEIISRRAELADEMNALPPVFVHGDCHTHNVVYAEGSLVFCDWQAAGLGRPVSDLAFPSVRAAPDGLAAPPALLDAYLATRPGQRDILERATLAEELATLVFLWPPYAEYNSPSGIAHVRHRTGELAARWLDTAALTGDVL
jgi:Ser/Thr protein kinase RdoA (MazF antagonist)